MLNRRHLRIKVLQALYAYFQSEQTNVQALEKSLYDSIEKIHELYIYLLLSFDEIRKIAIHRMEESKKKIRPSEDDLNPNRKLVDNVIFEELRNLSELKDIAEKHKVNWKGALKQEMFRKMFLAIRESETYFSYMNNGSVGREADIEFALALFKEEIANSELLLNFFEDESILWMDDIDLACSMVMKTLKSAKEEISILPLHKDEEDERDFVERLFHQTINLNPQNELLIDDLTKNWELERIAKMDVILMKMALAEMQTFESIPTSVTLNEFIEISKFYSTPKSNSFINGVLDKAIERLKSEGKIEKNERGLK